MNIICRLVALPLLYFLISCESRSPSDLWVKYLRSGEDSLLVEESIYESHADFESVLQRLWQMLESGSSQEQLVADAAFVRIARGLFLGPRVFSITDDVYWRELTVFLGEKFNKAGSETLERASAIYLRQIRRPVSESHADELGVPSFVELTGSTLDGNRL